MVKEYCKETNQNKKKIISTKNTQLIRLRKIYTLHWIEEIMVEKEPKEAIEILDKK